MNDVVETIAILIALGVVLTPVIGFVLFSRYLSRREKEALEQYGLLAEKES